MTIASILQTCRKLGIKLAVKEDRLLIEAPKGTVSSNILEYIKKYKEGIKEQLLATESSCSTRSTFIGVSDDKHEAYEERAAIMEYDGGLSRAEAQHAAQQLFGIEQR